MKAKFCSRKCQNTYISRNRSLTEEHKKKIGTANSSPRVLKGCLVCNKKFEVKPSGINRKFCGWICAGVAKRGANSSNWKGGLSKQDGYRSFMCARRRVKKIANGGSHTLAEWETRKAQYNWTCPCCHRSEPEIKLTEDHIVPTVKGGSDNIENIQPLCGSCNSRKHTKTVKYEYELVEVNQN